MGGPSSPLDTLIAAESELAEVRSQLAEAKRMMGVLRAAAVSEIDQHSALHHAYCDARNALSAEQEKHRLAHQRDPFSKMPASMHEAIKQVRLLAVEIADEVAGYRG